MAITDIENAEAGSSVRTKLNSVIALANAGREVLTANRTYYVRTDGNDSNDGLANTSGGAFATIAKAMEVVASKDWGIYKPTIQVGAGTWTVPVSLPPVLTTATPELLGDTTTPADVTISVSGSVCIERRSPGTAWLVRGFRLQSTGTGAGNVYCSSGELRLSNIDFNGNSSTGFDYLAINFGYINWVGNYTVSSSGSVHAWAQPFGSIKTSGISVNYSTASINMSGFWWYADRGQIDAFSMSFTGNNATATGARYRVLGSGGNLFVNGGGANYFPGNSAGSTANGGQYY